MNPELYERYLAKKAKKLGSEKADSEIRRVEAKIAKK